MLVDMITVRVLSTHVVEDIQVMDARRVAIVGLALCSIVGERRHDGDSVKGKTVKACCLFPEPTMFGWEGLEGMRRDKKRSGGRQRLNTLLNVRRVQDQTKANLTPGVSSLNPILRDRKANKLRRRQGGTCRIWCGGILIRRP